jgi:putative addiction module component (TIGR02574 family)
MAYNKSELLALPAKEKLALAEELWSSVEDEVLAATKDEILFAEERLQLHEAKPEEGMSVEAFKKYFAEKYGF